MSARQTNSISIDLADGTTVTDQLWMPFASARHRATDLIVPGHRAWLREHGLQSARTEPMFRKARFHELAGLVYTEEDDDVLRLAADFIAALFVLDDLMDTAADRISWDEVTAQAAVETVREATRSGRCPQSHLSGVSAVASAMADLTRRLWRRGTSPSSYFAEVDAYLDGVVEENKRRSAGFRSVDDYATVRVAFSAVYACVELALAARGQALAKPDRHLAHLANLSVSWVNDVWSWPKERALRERSNLVAVLMHASGLDECAAFHQACRLCDGVVEQYLRARRGREAAPTLRLLEGWMRGNLDWHEHGTDRYTAHLSVAPVFGAPPLPLRTVASCRSHVSRASTLGG